MEKKLTLNEQAKEIMRIAEESGVQSNFFFITTFKRYQVQLSILNELEKTMKEDTLDPAFTEYWTIHRDRLLREDSEYSAALESYAMKSGADWLLFGIPVATGIVCVEMLPISSEKCLALQCL